MKIKIIHIIILLSIPLIMTGQDYVVESFENMVKDLTAKTNPRIDNNGRRCALIKVYVNDDITAADGPVIGDIIDRGLEKWVYVSHDAKQIQLLFKGHMPLFIVFDDFNYPSITGQMTYILKLKETETVYSNTEYDAPITEIHASSSQSSIISERMDFLNTGPTDNQIITNISAQTLDANNPIIQNLINNMIFVEGGKFKMGSKGKDALADEKPLHVENVESFSIGKYEVTQKEWEAVMGSNPSYFKGSDLPVENVSWDDCQEFIKRLNRITGLSFRLPTEEEWEYAARGGKKSLGYKYSGSDDIDRVAWYDQNGGTRTSNVGLKKPNELGLHDMSGNVWEWTSSKYSINYKRPRNSMNIVYRGGSWCSDKPRCRMTHRPYSISKFYYKDLGFRLVL